MQDFTGVATHEAGHVWGALFSAFGSSSRGSACRHRAAFDAKPVADSDELDGDSDLKWTGIPTQNGTATV